MKSARVWILLVLAVLLPLRGAVAASMLCPTGTSSTSTTQVALHDHGSHEADHASAGHHDGAHEHGGSETCHACAAFCSLTPFVGEEPAVVAALDLSGVAFPAPAAPAPSFVCGGQERPPRSI